MDNKQFLEDKATTNAAAEEILSDEELDSVAGGTGSGDSIWTGSGDIIWGTGRGDRTTTNVRFGEYAGGTGRG